MTAAEYEAKFMELAKFVLRLVEDERDWVHKFEMKLRTEIKKQIMPYELIIYADVENRTLIIEIKVNDECIKREIN